MKFINNLTLGLVIICFVSLAVSQDCLVSKFPCYLINTLLSHKDDKHLLALQVKSEFKI